MSFYNEVWSSQYNIRIAKLERGVTFGHGSRMMLSYMPPVSLGTPIPASAVCTKSMQRPNSMSAELRRIPDPQLYLDDFVMGQADHVETDYNVMAGQHETVVFRSVMAVPFTEPMTLATLIEDMRRWAPYFEPHGWLPDDPQTIYETWCEANEVQPVASSHQRYPGTEAGIRRLRMAFDTRGVSADPEAVQRISNRMTAASASERSYSEGMSRLTNAVMNWRPYAGNAEFNQAIQTWLDADQISDLRLWDMVNRRDSLAAGASLMADPFGTRPLPDYIPRTPRQTPEPAPSAADMRAATAALPGIRIPTVVAGRRPLNLEG